MYGHGAIYHQIRYLIVINKANTNISYHSGKITGSAIVLEFISFATITATA
jgi:hypothetical protein